MWPVSDLVEKKRLKRCGLSPRASDTFEFHGLDFDGHFHFETRFPSGDILGGMEDGEEEKYISFFAGVVLTGV